MITRNTIKQWFNDFAGNHTQLAGFGYGYKPDISASEAERYRLMWVIPMACKVEGKEIFYSYEVFVADRVQDGRGDAVDVESDTFQICLDLLASLNYQTNNDWELEESSVITPFIEDGKDRVDGHSVTITFKAAFDYNECAIPKTSDITPPSSSCLPATININDDLFAEVESGALLNIAINYEDGSPVSVTFDGDTVLVPNNTGTTEWEALWP